MLKIGNLKISANNIPKIIAEISANHNQSLNKAIQLIKKASKNGADFVKIQTYTPENLTLDSFILGKKLISRGNIVKEVINIMISAIIIIFPKSIIGLIFENNKDPNATIVVNAV